MMRNNSLGSSVGVGRFEDRFLRIALRIATYPIALVVVNGIITSEWDFRPFPLTQDCLLRHRCRFGLTCKSVTCTSPSKGVFTPSRCSCCTASTTFCTAVEASSLPL